MALDETKTIQTDTVHGGAEVTIAAMNDSELFNIGRCTCDFVRRAMRNPEYRKMIQDKVEELRASGSFEQRS